MSLYYLINIRKTKPKLIKENSIPLYRTGPLARVHMESFHLT